MATEFREDRRQSLKNAQLDRDIDSGQVSQPVREQRPAKLEPFKAIIDARLECYPERYLRESFVYARDFVSDEDLNAQAHTWLSGTANVRRHRTTKEKPLERFTRDEQTALLELVGRLTSR